MVLEVVYSDGAIVQEINHGESVARVLDTSDWREYAYGILGDIALPNGTDDEKMMAGIRRYGAIIKAARASDDDGTVAALDQYDDAGAYRKDKVSIFLGILNADSNIVTDAELAAIIENWPTNND